MRCAKSEAMFLVQSLAPDTPRCQVTVIPGDPPSKARARFGKNGHAYTPKKTVEGEAHIASYLSQVPTFDANVAVVCIFYRRTRGRVDVDNLMKAVLDGATKAGMWRDDSQVTALLGILEHDPKNPRTVVACAVHRSSMDRSDQSIVAECKQCGDEFRYTPAPSQKPRLFCNRACASLSRGEDLSALARCRCCGQEFKRKSARQSLCSEPCRIEQLREDKAAKRRPAGKCRVCGTKTSRPEYVRCRACWKVKATEPVAA